MPSENVSSFGVIDVEGMLALPEGYGFRPSRGGISDGTFPLTG
jgi:hypothetical protein